MSTSGGITAASQAAARRIYVDLYGADPTGATDSTAAFIRAQTAGGANPYVLVGSVGTYLLGTPGDITTFGRRQGFIGQGDDVTTLNYVGNGTCLKATDTAFDQELSVGGQFADFTIDGIGAGAAATGFAYGNLNSGQGEFTVNNFRGATAIGVHWVNTAAGTTWSERGIWAIHAKYNKNNFVWDTSSFDYSTFDLYSVSLVNQNALTLQNSAALSGVVLNVKGNCIGGAGNTAWAIGFDPAGADLAGVSQIVNSDVNISMEANGTGVGHIALVMHGGAGCNFYGFGQLGLITANIAFSNAVIGANSLFAMSGFVSVPGVGIPTAGDSLVIGSGSEYAVGGGLGFTIFGPTVFATHADIWATLLVSGNNNIGFSGYNPNLRAKKITLLVRQPSTGAAGTVTWPAFVHWPSGTPPTLSATNLHVDLLEFTYHPDTGTLYGALIGHDYVA